MNKMQEIRIEKVTLNIGAGKDQKMLEKGVKLFKSITNKQPVKTITQKRLQAWSLRPGLPIGVKVTVRGEDAVALAKRIIAAKDDVLAESYFDDFGNISFGIPEYVDIADTKYDPEIGIIGLQASITLGRPGYRIKRRKLQKKRIPPHKQVNKQEAIDYMKANFNIKLGEEA